MRTVNAKTKGQPNVESEQENKAAVETHAATGEGSGTTPANAGRRRVFIGLGVGAVVVIGAAMAMQRSSSSSATGTVTADITLVTSDRADVDCLAAAGVETYRCAFANETTPWTGDEAHKLKPYFTTDRHLYLIPGLFLDPALAERFKSEPADKPRDQLKRFTAKCHLKVLGKVGGTRVRWLATGAWSPPEEVDVATVIDCKVEG